MSTRYINMFRAKAAYDGQWMFGDILHGTHIKHPRGTTTIIPDTVGMYTGLIDRNGTRIFEGDILGGYLDDEPPNYQSIVVVKWDGFGWCTQEGDAMPDPMNKSDGEDFEVIGNIYDNPGLIAEANI